MKKPQIYCVVSDISGLNFYLDYNGNSYFLFNQRYRSNIESYFKSGVPLEIALRAVKRGTPDNIRNISNKFPVYIRYIEKEYGIQVLDKTMKKRRVMLDAQNSANSPFIEFDNKEIPEPIN